MTTRQASREGLRSRYDGQRMSEEAYLALPEEKPYLEWVDGVVVQKAVPNRTHALLVLKIGNAFFVYMELVGGSAGPERRVFLSVTGRVYRLPDIAYWAPNRVDKDDSAPTVAVEVRSPGEGMNSQRGKCRRYRANGIPVCWLVDPDRRTVEVFEGELDGKVLAAGDVLETPHMPGFSLPLDELFAVLDRQRRVGLARITPPSTGSVTPVM